MHYHKDLPECGLSIIHKCNFSADISVKKFDYQYNLSRDVEIPPY